MRRLILIFIIGLLYSCQKSGLEPKDAVQYLVHKINSLTTLQIPDEYTILQAETMNTKEQDLMFARVSLTKTDIVNLAEKFRYLRRHTSGPGFGRIPGGWEFYHEIKGQEQYKMFIDTLNNQLIIQHRILY